MITPASTGTARSHGGQEQCTYDPSLDELRVAIFHSKGHDHLLRTLIAADQPPVPLQQRRAVLPIDQAVHQYAHQARLATTAWRLETSGKVQKPQVP